MNELVKEFQLRYPKLVKEMKEASHHYSEKELNPYHLESDIFTHTMMVCQEARNASLSYFLNVVCLLHDIGKPACREENRAKQRVNFIGHEGYSAYMAIDIMRDFGLTNEEIIHNFQIIALHTEIFKLSEEKFGLRLLNNIKLFDDLLKVSKCDRNGRFHSGEEKEFKPGFMGFFDVEERENEVIVLIGLPGSGKSTIRIEYPDYEVLSWDDTMEEMYEGSTYGEKFAKADDKEVKKVLEEKRKRLVSEKKNVIIDMTNLTRKSRRRRLSAFPKSYKRTAIVCLVGFEELKQRNEKRKAEGKFIKWEVFERMMKQTYPPMFDEFESVEWRLS